MPDAFNLHLEDSEIKSTREAIFARRRPTSSLVRLCAETESFLIEAALSDAETLHFTWGPLSREAVLELGDAFICLSLIQAGDTHHRLVSYAISLYNELPPAAA